MNRMAAVGPMKLCRIASLCCVRPAFWVREIGYNSPHRSNALLLPAFCDMIGNTPPPSCRYNQSLPHLLPRQAFLFSAFVCESIRGRSAGPSGSVSAAEGFQNVDGDGLPVANAIGKRRPLW